MAKRQNTSDANGGTAATVGSEAQLWQMADALHGSMDAAEYKHVCLGLLFPKYISDAFEERRAVLLAQKAKGAEHEDTDYYRAQGHFWVPPQALAAPEGAGAPGHCRPARGRVTATLREKQARPRRSMPRPPLPIRVFERSVCGSCPPRRF